MLSKARIKLIHSLSQKKYRQEHQLFVAEGLKIIKELLSLDPDRIHSLYATASGLESVRKELPEQIDCETIDQKELKQISMQTSPQEILALLNIKHPRWVQEELEESYSLVLDRIQDPGNMGSIIRIADWFGIRNIICSMDSADLYNPKVIQASMGSFLRVKVFYRRLTDLLTEFSSGAGSEGEIGSGGENRSGGGTASAGKDGFGIYGTVLEGKSIYDVSFGTKGFIILGNESQGISSELLTLIDHKIMIPSHSGSPRPDSLNVASAAAIVCSELKRR